LGHDVALHRRENTQELVLFRFAHAVLLERLAQELDHEVHLGLGVLESLVDLVHRVAGVLAASAGERADLLDDLLLHARKLHVLERALGARVGGRRSMVSPTTRVMTGSPPRRE
jgi:hypothetical protein